MGVAEWGTEEEGVVVRIGNEGSWFNSKDIARLGRALDVRAEAQVAINENLANLNTKGYVARHVKFKESMESATLDTRSFRRTHSRHRRPRAQAAEIVQESGGRVEIANEMAELKKNKGGYTDTAAVLMARFKMLLAAVSDGRSG